jgi:hypothetical protein
MLGVERLNIGVEGVHQFYVADRFGWGVETGSTDNDVSHGSRYPLFVSASM